MIRKNNKHSKFQRTLQAKKDSGVKEVFWRINTIEHKKQAEEIGCIVEPWLYEIVTRQQPHIHQIRSTLLKSLHYRNKNGKKTYVTKLNDKDIKLLDAYNIPYRAVKYRIQF